MRKWMNTLFFGSFFIAAVLIEIYSIIVLEGNLFSTIGLGIVVIITGYLFIDTIQSSLKQGKEEAKFYLDRVFSEEAEKWNERYTELLNLSKASYTATKKNSAAFTEQFEEVLSRLQALEENNTKAWQRITELQKKSLEGQKKALNLEIQYNKENTKQILSLLTDEEKTNEIKEQLTKILTLLENDNEKTSEPNWILEEDKDTSEPDWSIEEEPEPEAEIQSDIADEQPTVVPLYDDPNKALSADEIAQLFASFGK